MHTLAAAQQVAVTASSSLCRSSSCTAPSLLRDGFLPSSQMRCALSSSISSRMEIFLNTIPSPSSLSSTSCKIAFPHEVLLVRRSHASVSKSGNRSSQDSGHNRLSTKKLCSITCLASRKDRRETAAGEKEFEPDMLSLRTGFSKKFPGEDSSAFEHDWDDLNNDDRVEVKSFKGGRNSYGRSVQYPTTSSTDSPRDKYNNNNNFRTRNKPDNPSSRLGGSREEVTGNEPRNPQVQGIGRQRAAFRDTRSHRTGTGGVDGSWSESGWNNTREGAYIGGRSRIERGEVGGTRSPRGSGERRGNDSTARMFRERDGGRIVGNNGNLRTRRTSDDSRRRGRKGKDPYGGTEEWSKDTPNFQDEVKKKKPVIEPVNFTSAMSKIPHVAILGGGMSGLVCALTLEEHGIHSTVFDTGKHGLGGRMATRYVDEHNGAGLVFDHAAQFFTVTDSRFQNLVDRWMSEGFVKKWNGNVGTLQAGGQYSELPLATRYIGTNGMRSLADSILSQSRLIDVKRPCWISRMDAMNGCWTLTENRKPQGEFDVVVIAHNGKCANRLLSTAHVPLVARQMKRLELSSIWAMLAAFKEPLPLPGGEILDGAFVDGVNSLSWMGNNSSKLVPLDEKSPQCWTFFSTAAYGKGNKVPQESVPVVKAQKVKHDMLRGVETALGLSEDSLPMPIYTRVQLWGAALPTNTPDVPCIFDAQARVGICGDWLLGSSLEAAAMSGMALADHIAKYRDSGDQEGVDFNIGLQQSFSFVKGSDIGQFPGTEALPIQSLEVFANT